MKELQCIYFAFPKACLTVGDYRWKFSNQSVHNIFLNHLQIYTKDNGDIVVFIMWVSGVIEWFTLSPLWSRFNPGLIVQSLFRKPTSQWCFLKDGPSTHSPENLD